MTAIILKWLVGYIISWNTLLMVFFVVGAIQDKYPTLKQYCLNHLWAIDRRWNVWFGGSSKEFMSTRIYNYKTKNIVAGWCYQILNWIDPGHCENAAKRDYDSDHSSEAILK